VIVATGAAGAGAVGGAGVGGRVTVAAGVAEAATTGIAVGAGVGGRVAVAGGAAGAAAAGIAVGAGVGARVAVAAGPAGAGTEGAAVGVGVGGRVAVAAGATGAGVAISLDFVGATEGAGVDAALGVGVTSRATMFCVGWQVAAVIDRPASRRVRASVFLIVSDAEHTACGASQTGRSGAGYSRK
jgi:hypothetical protein